MLKTWKRARPLPILFILPPRTPLPLPPNVRGRRRGVGENVKKHAPPPPRALATASLYFLYTQIPLLPVIKKKFFFFSSSGGRNYPLAGGLVSLSFFIL